MSNIQTGAERSEERRVGKECRCRWSPHHKKKKLMENPEVLLLDEPSEGLSPLYVHLLEEYLASLRSQWPNHGSDRPERPRRVGARRPRLRPREWDGLLRRTQARVPRERFFFQAEDGIRDRSRHSC